MQSYMYFTLDQSHPWFHGVTWDKLYDMDAAFKPEVNGELDTQNFMKFDEVLYLFLSSLFFSFLPFSTIGIVFL